MKNSLLVHLSRPNLLLQTGRVVEYVVVDEITLGKWEVTGILKGPTPADNWDYSWFQTPQQLNFFLKLIQFSIADIRGTFPGIIPVSALPATTAIISSIPASGTFTVGSNGVILVQTGPASASGTFTIAANPSSVSKLQQCRECSRELSSLLDAYYGRDPNVAALCSKCRPRNS